MSCGHDKNGGRYSTVAELPLAVVHEVNIRWERAKINLAELAKKRWQDGLSIDQLQEIFGYRKTAIKTHLRKIREEGNYCHI